MKITKHFLLAGAFLLTTLFVSNHVLLSQGIRPPRRGSNMPSPTEYKVADIQISGVKYLNKESLKDISGISAGDQIQVPGETIQKAINNYWDQGLFSDVEITADSIVRDKIYLNIFLQERPRLNKFTIKGVKSSDKKELQKKIQLKQGKQITNNVINNTRHLIRKYYIEDGYHQVDVDIKKEDVKDMQNRVNLTIKVDRNERVKIKDIVIKGNKEFSEWRLERKMEDTKEKNLWNIFSSSKFIEDKFEEDKEKLISFYNSNGYRDAKIVEDSIAIVSDDRMKLFITINEGRKYYFGDINWVGNTKYSAKRLNQVLGIEKGDPYDKELLQKRVFRAQDAVSSLYLDNGYLFSNVNPVEIGIDKDSINYEMRVFEGEQARIDEVMIRGNTKTNEYVIRRELRTMPGDLFSKQDIVRSVRELSQLGYFDAEKINPQPIPNKSEGTVDIKYDLTEKSSDQLEISGGWGAGTLVGTIGLKFNNFSAKNLFNFDRWNPIPSGDGEKLSIRAQSNGSYYQSYNISFVEPWFGGKRPNDFSVSFYHTIRNNRSRRRLNQSSDKWLKITGASVGLSRKIRWPDDFFNLRHEISYQQYHLKDWEGYFLFEDGRSNNFSFTTKFSRNSIDQPIYPRRGSKFSLSLQVTPPYSLMNNNVNYGQLSDRKKYKWIEYHKWQFKSEWYFRVVGDLVLFTGGEFGYLAHYNDAIGPSPFEGFDVGGDGLTGYNIYGRETIAMRGYENSSLTPRIDGKKSGNVYDKFTMELRFPFVQKTSATVYGLAFLEGGNCWFDIESFSPYDIKRSAGVGIRAFLPMFGLLGVDWAYGFDQIEGQPGANQGNFHFTIGRQF